MKQCQLQIFSILLRGDNIGIMPKSQPGVDSLSLMEGIQWQMAVDGMCNYTMDY